VSSSDRELRDAQIAARRAKRLAERAASSAQRRAQSAKEAAERAARLAQRARASAGSRSAQDGMRDSGQDQADSAPQSRQEAWHDGSYQQSGGARQAQSRRAQRQYARYRRQSLLRRLFADKALYRDKTRGKICGVCAGMAAYLEVKVWQVRLFALLGLIFVPTVAVLVYFILYFLMDDKPYYKEVVDRFESEGLDQDDEVFATGEAMTSFNGADQATTKARRGGKDSAESQAYARPARARREPNGLGQRSNAQILGLAKAKFAYLESRVRAIESHVTSSQFELQRELQKLAGDAR